MAEVQQLPFDAPIPGQSFTSELGNRPWEKPPQYVTVEDAIDFYMQRINEDDFKQPLLDVIELGMPLTSIANALQLSSVMEGKHTIDSKDYSNTEIALAVKKAGDKFKDQKINEDTMTDESEPVVEEEQPTGLMARRM